MDLTTLTPEERQAAEQAVAKLRSEGLSIHYFDKTSTVSIAVPGHIVKNHRTLAYIAPQAEAFAPAMLNGLKLTEASNEQLIELAIKHKIVDDVRWKRDGAVTSPYVMDYDFLTHFNAFLNALRSL